MTTPPLSPEEYEEAAALSALIGPAIEQALKPEPVEVYGVLFAGDAWLPTFHDHSWWARSVRWSCGRPGYRPMFDHETAYRAAIREQYALARVRAGILDPTHPRIVDLGSIT